MSGVAIVAIAVIGFLLLLIAAIRRTGKGDDPLSVTRLHAENAELRSRAVESEKRNELLTNRTIALEDALARANARVEAAEAANLLEMDARAAADRRADAAKAEADRIGAKYEDVIGVLKELLQEQGQL